jgi:hypothetical protein
MAAVKWLAANLTSTPRKDVTHVYVVIEKRVAGDRDMVQVILCGVPCPHVTEILQAATENGEKARAEIGKPSLCGYTDAD